MAHHHYPIVKKTYLTFFHENMAYNWSFLKKSLFLPFPSFPFVPRVLKNEFRHEKD